MHYAMHTMHCSLCSCVHLWLPSVVSLGGGTEDSCCNGWALPSCPICYHIVYHWLHVCTWFQFLVTTVSRIAYCLLSMALPPPHGLPQRCFFPPWASNWRLPTSWRHPVSQRSSALCPSTGTLVLAGTLGRVVSVDLQSKVTTVKWKGQQICTGMWTPPITTYWMWYFGLNCP